MMKYPDLVLGGAKEYFAKDFQITCNNLICLNVFDYNLLNTKFRFKKLIWWVQDERFFSSEKFLIFYEKIKEYDFELYIPNYIKFYQNFTNIKKKIVTVKTTYYYNGRDIYLGKNACVGALELLRLLFKSDKILIFGVSLNYSWFSDGRKIIDNIDQSGHLDLHIKKIQISQLLNLLDNYNKYGIKVEFSKNSLLNKYYLKNKINLENKEKIILHLGLPKTGSTFLQNIFNKNINLFKEIKYVHDFRKLQFKKKNNEVDEFKKLISDKISYFFSNEVFLSDYIVPGKDFAPKKGIIPNFSEELDNFADFAKSHKITFILIIRDLAEIYVSLANQIAKQSGRESSEEILKTYNEIHFDINRIDNFLKKILEIGSLKIFEFNKIINTKSEEFDKFFKLLQINSHELKLNDKNFRVNPSISEKGLKIMNLIKKELDANEYLKIRKYVQANFPKEKLLDHENKFFKKYSDLSKQNYDFIKNKYNEYF